MARHKLRWGLWKAIVGNAAIAAGVFFLFIGALAAEAQSGADIAGTWQGTVQGGKGPRVVLKVVKGDAATEWGGLVYELDSNIAFAGRTTTSMSLQGGVLRFTVKSTEASYEGKLSTDGALFAGTWTQGGQAHSLELVRATEATAWDIPKEDAAMPKDADPDWDVTTVRPADPDSRSNGFHLNGRNIFIEDESVESMLLVGFGVHRKQLANAPDWLNTDRWDAKGVPDVLGQPNNKQFEGMVQKLLVERFGLKFHWETRDLSVYGVNVAKGGVKLVKSAGDPNGLPDETGNGGNGQQTMRFTNVSMDDFAESMEFEMDKPIVNQTGLEGKYDFTLRWTYDEGRVGADPNAPPGLFTAVQEQLGLKFDSVKAPAKVLVIDHVEKPSAN
jgi:uncharacterized protein (TIGR03435 family)